MGWLSAAFVVLVVLVVAGLLATAMHDEPADAMSEEDEMHDDWNGAW